MLKLSRSDQFGLWLNIDREIVRASLPIAKGIAAATGTKLDETYFANFIDSDELAKLAAFRSGSRGR